MLILNRRERQSILVPELGMKITVVEIRNGCVRIGLEAPRDVRIVRDDAKNTTKGVDRDAA